jgi:hypothetical protein
MAIRSKSPGKCKRYLKKKISINMEEYKNGMFVSPAQAIAVSYSQTIKRFPRCKNHLSRKNNYKINLKKKKNSLSSKKKRRSKKIKRSKKEIQSARNFILNDGTLNF